MSNQIAFISGANCGIGLATATVLARDHGYHVVIGSRSLEAGEIAASSITSSGHTASAVQLDLDSDVSIAAAVDHIRSKYGHLDVLVNNAGILIDYQQLQVRELFTRTLSTNVIGAACLTDACLPLLRAAPMPRIVFVSSIMGSLDRSLDETTPWYAIDYKAYDTSKAALNMLALNYKRILGAGAKVNIICPGLVKTKLTRGMAGTSEPEVGAARVVEMSTIGEGGPSGTFSNSHGVIPW